MKKMAVKKIILTFLLLLQVSFVSCAEGPYNGMMSGYGHMMGYGYYGGFMWLLILVAVIIAIYFLIKLSRFKGTDHSIPETLLDILKKRYAKGEINKEEYEQKKKDLQL
jgi:putative membrane protein